MSRSQILSIGIDPVTLPEALERCLAYIDGDRPRLVVTPNAEIAYMAERDPELSKLLNAADLAIPDGTGIVLAAKLLGRPVPEKVAGVDLATSLLAALSARGRGRVYLLGAKPEVVAEAARRIQERYPGLTVAGYRDGYFAPAEEAAVVAEIRKAAPDVLFAGMGVPKQEFWLKQHLGELNARVCFGVGGTLDVWANPTNRAPQWAVQTNLEWLWRIVKFGRYGRSLPPLFKFMMLVLGQRVTGKGRPS